MELRPYQKELKSKLYDTLRRTKKALVVMPTGGGKTVLMASIIKDMVSKDLRILVLVHRDFLVSQTIRTIERAGMEVMPDYVNSKRKKIDSSITVAMIQTLAVNPSLLNTKIDVIITDEAHHAAASTYKRIHKQFPDAWHIGFTATPVRTGGEPIGIIYDEIVETVQYADLVRLGFLVAPKMLVPSVQADLSTVKIKMGDYDEHQAGIVMSQKEILGSVVEEYKRNLNGKRSCVFACDVQHSINIRDSFLKEGIPAAHIDGTTPEVERREILRKYSDGEILVLSNVGIFTEGYDLPLIEGIQLARPTMSLGLYMQMAGRGSRPAEGKDSVTIIDHANNVKTHGSPMLKREWDIQKTENQKKKEIQKRKKNKPTQKRVLVITEKTSNFEEFNIETEQGRELVRLISLVEEKDWRTKQGKPNYYWAWKTFLSMYRPSFSQVVAFQRYANYKESWIKIARKEIDELYPKG